MSTDTLSRLHWNVHVINLLRASTRPVGEGARVLSGEEVLEMREKYSMGWTADEFAELLQSRDQEAADRVRSTSRVG